MTMIGQSIESKPKPAVAVWILCVLAVVLVALSFAINSIHPAIAAVFPAILAILLSLGQKSGFYADFTSESLNVDQPRIAIRYAEILGLVAPKRPGDPETSGPKHYPIEVIYPGGVLSIPAHLNVPSDEVYRFLYSHIREQQSQHVHRKLRDHLDKEIGVFGPQKVFVYHGREEQGSAGSFFAVIAWMVAMTISGLVWVTVEATMNRKDMKFWQAFGWFFFGFGLLFWLIMWLVSRQYKVGNSIKNPSESSLIISPRGLALVQGDLEGVMEWEELKDVKYNSKPAPAAQGKPAGHGVRLHFGDIDIWIADIYDCPVWMIYQRILDYWQ